MEDSAIENDPAILDFNRGLSEEQKENLLVVGSVASEVIVEAQKTFRVSERGAEPEEEEANVPDACTVYEHKDFPGTFMDNHVYMETN